MLLQRHALLCSALLLSSDLLWGKPCTSQTKEGSSCSLAIRDLHPTQLSYGAIEVTMRSKTFAAMSESKLSKYLDKHKAPVVIGPQGNVYITDHHHMALALAAVKGKDFEIQAEVQENWSGLKAAEFWDSMDSAEYTYLYDAEGQGPLSNKTLPDSLFALDDDPYRALAWGVRKNNGYDESNTPHADFYWAQFFRKKIAKSLIEKDFDKAVKQGTKLAQSAEAEGLPGYQN